MKRLILALPYLAVAAVVGVGAPPLAGWIDVKLRPVLGDAVVEHTTISRGRICWAVSWQKYREASPLVIRYSIRYGRFAEPIPTIAFRDDKPISNYERRPGLNRADLCAIIDPDVTSGTLVEVENEIVYQMPHGLWTVRDGLPTVSAVMP